MPSREHMRVDPILTNIGVGYRNEGLIWDKILPVATALERSAKFPIWGKEGFRLRSDLASPNSGGTEVYYEYSLGSYMADGHMQTVYVPNASEAQEPFDELRDGTEVVMDGINLGIEKAVVDVVTSTAVVPTDAPTTKWDAISTSTIDDHLEEMEAYRAEVAGYIGRDPNVMVIGRDLFSALKSQLGILDLIKYSSGYPITEALLAQMYGLDEVIVSRALYDAADEGAAPNLDYLWPDETALMFYRGPTEQDRVSGRPTSSLKRPTLGHTVFWTGAPGSVAGVQVQTAPINPGVIGGRGTHGGVEVIATAYYDALIQASYAGIRLTDCLT